MKQVNQGAPRAAELFKDTYRQECHRINRIMTWLLLGQWVAGILFALFYSPLTWIGQTYEIHVHVWVAVLMGGGLSGFGILWLRQFPETALTRHVVAVIQMLWSALLIHLSGGRIETHFHIFASLAILSVYRDWKILVTATVTVAADHFVRGVWYPLSAFGVVTESPFRWLEHAAWVIFEISFLIPGCIRLRKDIYEMCAQQTDLERSKRMTEEKIQKRTQALVDTNRKLAVKTRETEKMALVARFTDNAVIITDSKSRIEWTNEAFTRMTGFTLEECRGKNPQDILKGPETNPQVSQIIQNAETIQQGYDVEIVNHFRDGLPCWLSIESRPIFNDKQEIIRFVQIASNISARKKVERERERLQDQLVASSRQAGMAEIATNVLHNVGNILNSVNVSATLLQTRFDGHRLSSLQKVTRLLQDHEENFVTFVRDDPRGKKLPNYLHKLVDALQKEQNHIDLELEELLHNIEHIKEIVSVQQSMAQVSGMSQELCPHDLIESALNAVKASLGNHGIQIVKNIDHEMQPFYSDKHKILQILINLISNAKDAVVEHDTASPTIEIEVSGTDEEVVFNVRDNGTGIPSDRLEKVFQHGFTTKRTGHGFGLHASANTATELQGNLTVASPGPQMGAEFQLRIPTTTSPITQ